MATDPTTLKSVVLAVRAGLAALAVARDDQQRRYIAGLLCRDAAVLAEHCLKRNAWLNTAYDWIETHKDDLDVDDLKAREERWLLNLRQYEVAMELLGQTLEALPVTRSPAPTTASQETLL